MRLRRRRSHGWVMIMVMLVLTLLSLLVASFYVTSTDSAAMSRIIVGQQVAMSHADTGLQEALRALRAQQLDLSVITGPCTSADIDAQTCTTAFASPLIDNGRTDDLGGNGGLQYAYIVYQRPNGGDPGQPSNRFVIRSTGYYGYSTTSSNLITSIVEAEVDVGKESRFQCLGGYECQ